MDTTRHFESSQTAWQEKSIGISTKRRKRFPKPETLKMPPITQGRWTPIPNDAASRLLETGKHHAFIVLYAMLAEATANQCWKISKPISHIMRETNLSKGTVRKAQQELEKAGLTTRVAGCARRKITYEITPIANYGQAQLSQKKDSATTGNWEL